MKTLEVIKKAPDAFVKLQMLVFRETNEFPWDVPMKTNKCCDGKEVVVALFFMPRNTQGGNAAQHVSTVIIIRKVAFMDSAGR